MLSCHPLAKNCLQDNLRWSISQDEEGFTLSALQACSHWSATCHGEICAIDLCRTRSPSHARGLLPVDDKRGLLKAKGWRHATFVTPPSFEGRKQKIVYIETSHQFGLWRAISASLLRSQTSRPESENLSSGQRPCFKPSCFAIFAIDNSWATHANLDINHFDVHGAQRDEPGKTATWTISQRDNKWRWFLSTQ